MLSWWCDMFQHRPGVVVPSFVCGWLQEETTDCTTAEAVSESRESLAEICHM